MKSSGSGEKEHNSAKVAEKEPLSPCPLRGEQLGGSRSGAAPPAKGLSACTPLCPALPGRGGRRAQGRPRQEEGWKVSGNGGRDGHVRVWTRRGLSPRSRGRCRCACCRASRPPWTPTLPAPRAPALHGAPLPAGSGLTVDSGRPACPAAAAQVGLQDHTGARGTPAPDSTHAI